MQSQPKYNLRLKRSKGFTMVELLVSMLIFSIGMLGLGYLQLTSMRTNQMAFMRSQASTIAYDMADRMRANIVGTQADDYDGSPVASDVDCEGADETCVPADLAAYDMSSWLGAIQTLPSGSGVVAGLGGSQYSITIRWDQDRSGATGTNCPPQSTDDLRCFQLSVTL